MSGKYNYTVEYSDIISVSGGKVRFLTEYSGVFGVGKVSDEECLDCSPCVDCDQKPEGLCFVGAVVNGFVHFYMWLLVILYIFMYRIRIRFK